jgi:hypothetical protein
MKRQNAAFSPNGSFPDVRRNVGWRREGQQRAESVNPKSRI